MTHYLLEFQISLILHDYSTVSIWNWNLRNVQYFASPVVVSCIELPYDFESGNSLRIQQFKYF